jgi:hypothetical protein
MAMQLSRPAAAPPCENAGRSPPPIGYLDRHLGEQIESISVYYR